MAPLFIACIACATVYVSGTVCGAWTLTGIDIDCMWYLVIRFTCDCKYVKLAENYGINTMCLNPDHNGGLSKINSKVNK